MKPDGQTPRRSQVLEGVVGGEYDAISNPEYPRKRLARRVTYLVPTVLD